VSKLRFRLSALFGGGIGYFFLAEISIIEGGLLGGIIGAIIGPICGLFSTD